VFGPTGVEGRKSNQAGSELSEGVEENLVLQRGSGKRKET